MSKKRRAWTVCKFKRRGGGGGGGEKEGGGGGEGKILSRKDSGRERTEKQCNILNTINHLQLTLLNVLQSIKEKQNKLLQELYSTRKWKVFTRSRQKEANKLTST